MVTGAADPVCGESAGVLEELAYALESGDAERAQNAYLKAREIDARVSGLKEALVAGRETARLSPPRRRSLGHLEVYAAASDQIDQIDLIVRDVRALTRAALSVVQPGDPVPDPLPTAIRGLARMTETLAAYLETSGDPADTHRLALEAAREASVLLTARGPGEESVRQRTRRPGPLVGRRHRRGSTGVDRGTGLQTLAETARNTSGPDQDGPL